MRVLPALRLLAVPLVAALCVTPATAAAATAGPTAGAPPASEDGPVQTSPQRQQLQSALDAMVAAGVPGAIAEVRGEDGVWRGTSGVASVYSERSPRPDGRFRVGSVTKTFVATVVLQLVGEGEIALDAPVERYLPGIIPGDQGITVRQLMNHTSGIYDYARDLLAGDSVDEAVRSIREMRFRKFRYEDLVRIAMRHEPEFQPRPKGRWYSNTNYILLGMLIEDVTRDSPRSEIRQRIIEPLGLENTSFPEWNPLILGPNPRAYVDKPRGRPLDVTVYSPSWARTAGAIISTASDLNHFYRALLRGELLSAALLKEMKTTVELPGGPAPGVMHYGLGLMALPGCTGLVWGHNGAVPGFLTYTFTSADGQRQVTLSVNEYPLIARGPAFNAALGQLLTAAFCGQTQSRAATQDAQDAQGSQVVRPPPVLGPMPARPAR